MSPEAETNAAENFIGARGESSYGNRRRWAVHGLSAIDAGTPDRGENDGDLTDAIDTVANILHWLEHRGCADPMQILPAARRHFIAERQGGDR